ncbi:DUF2066 domain-containing protein [Pleionea sediminis]|uniref:DUF2066 domain-containing protein n=1 Tax=Pleionea sediminis TaxID=2569479 RepID=UPI0011846E07|nr:DUF2066 domain-containing protein [Pleionea sediminis]
MRVIFKSIAIWVLLSAWMVTSVSAADSDLYTVMWPVKDRGGAAQRAAMLSSFKQVLVRASGTRDALEGFYVQESFKKVSSFIRTYAYQEIVDSETNEKQMYLKVEFDGRAVQRLLQDAAVPMWGGSRPVTLMWLAYEESFARKVLSSSTPEDNSLKDEFMRQIHRRGLPTVLPLMDLEDEMQVSASDVWARFPEPIEAASARYGSDAVLAGRVSSHNDSWQGRFMLTISGDVTYQDFDAVSQENLLRDVTDWLGERLCKVFCVTESFSANQWQLLIEDVGSFYSYRELISYLESLSAIRKVEVAQTKGRAMMVNVDLVGDVESLKQAIRLDQKLIPVTDSFRIESAIENLKAEKDPEPINANGVLVMENPDQSKAEDNNDVPELPEAEKGNETGAEVVVVQVASEPEEPQKILVYQWRP